MSVVSEYYDQGRNKIVEEEAYSAYFRKLLIKHANNTHSQEELDAADKAQLIAWYKELVKTTSG
jgi:hypothetical protein